MATPQTSSPPAVPAAPTSAPPAAEAAEKPTAAAPAEEPKELAKPSKKLSVVARLVRVALALAALAGAA